MARYNFSVYDSFARWVKISTCAVMMYESKEQINSVDTGWRISIYIARSQINLNIYRIFSSNSAISLSTVIPSPSQSVTQQITDDDLCISLLATTLPSRNVSGAFEKEEMIFLRCLLTLQSITSADSSCACACFGNSTEMFATSSDCPF